MRERWMDGWMVGRVGMGIWMKIKQKKGGIPTLKAVALVAQKHL
jgi:hypothetical protein